MLSMSCTIEELKVTFQEDMRLMVFTIIGALLIYDITDMSSFEKVKDWLKEVRTYLSPDAPILLAGNKCDLKDNAAVSFMEAEE